MDDLILRWTQVLRMEMIGEHGLEESVAAFAEPLPLHLPFEVLEIIASIVASQKNTSQTTLARCCRVSKAWCLAFVEKLYRKPYFRNYTTFLKFTETVAPKGRVRSHPVLLEPYGDMVEELNLWTMNYHPGRAITARVISRCKHTLKAFYGPYAAPGPSKFGSNCWLALSNCKQLERLDLSAMTLDNADHVAFRMILQQLHKIRSLKTPSSSQWPSAIFLPASLDSLQIQDARPTDHLLERIVEGMDDDHPLNIQTLSVRLGIFRQTYQDLNQQSTGMGGLTILPRLIQGISKTLVDLRVYGMRHPERMTLIFPNEPTYCPHLRYLSIQENAWLEHGQLGRISSAPSVSPPAQPLRYLKLWRKEELDHRETSPSVGIVEFIAVLKSTPLLDNLQTLVVKEAMTWHRESDRLEDIYRFLKKKARRKGWDVALSGVWLEKESLRR